MSQILFPLLALFPLMIVLFNPSISYNLSLRHILPWANASLFQLCNLVHPISCRLHTFDTLRDKLNIPSQLFYFYLHIRHFFHSQSLLLTLEKPTTFEYLCAQDPHQLHLVSSIHRILHESTPLTEFTHLYMRRWAQLLGKPISSQLWDRIWSSTFKSSKCVLQRETSIKVLMLLYKTPEVIHKYDPSYSSNCWRCEWLVGSLFHIFWQCSLSQPFWQDVMILIQTVANVYPSD